MKLNNSQRNQLCKEITTFLQRFADDTQFGKRFNSTFKTNASVTQIGFSAYYERTVSYTDLQYSYSLEDLTDAAIDMIKHKLDFLVDASETNLIKEANIAINRIKEIRSRYECTLQEQKSQDQVESTKKLAAKLEALEATVDTISEENDRLKQKMAQLESQIANTPPPRRSIFC